MIREACRDDAARIAEIFNHYVLTSTAIFSNTCVTERQMACKILSPEDFTPFLVNVTDGVVDGYCYAHKWSNDEVYAGTMEVTIYLHHEAVGRGTGSTLLAELIRRCRKKGVHTLVSIITDGNEASEVMHRRLGFECVGRLLGVGYKFGKYIGDAYYQLML